MYLWDVSLSISVLKLIIKEPWAEYRFHLPYNRYRKVLKFGKFIDFLCYTLNTTWLCTYLPSDSESVKYLCIHLPSRVIPIFPRSSRVHMHTTMHNSNLTITQIDYALPTIILKSKISTVIIYVNICNDSYGHVFWLFLQSPIGKKGRICRSVDRLFLQSK